MLILHVLTVMNVIRLKPSRLAQLNRTPRFTVVRVQTTYEALTVVSSVVDTIKLKLIVNLFLLSD